MKVVCVIPCYERLEISIESINLLKDRQTLKPIVVVVGWSAIEKEIAKRTGSHFVACKNDYLGNKWQTGIDFAKTLDPDAILILGSDTWLTPDWVHYCASKITAGADLVGKIKWYSCNLRSSQIEIIQCEYIRSPAADSPVGGGRMISRKILDKLNWHLYPRNKKSCLDFESTLRMKLHNPKIMIFNTNKHKVMGIKGSWTTLNSFSRLKKADTSKIRRLEDISIKDIPLWLRTHFPGSLHVIKKISPDLLEWN